MAERFGKEQVCSVGTFSTIKIKGFMAAFGSINSIPASEIRQISSLTDTSDETLLDIITRAVKEPRLKDFLKKNSDILYSFPIVEKQPRTTSIHACAIIVFPNVMTSKEWCPVRSQNGLMVTEWGGYEMDAAGFLKDDILGIKQLDKFTDILKRIKQNTGKDIDIFNLPYDSEVYRYFANGWNGDVFQLTTEGLKNYTRQLRPKSINDLIATVALYRPGPMQNHYHEIYAQCQNDGRKPNYLWGTEEITKDTHGLIIYQEQVMKVFQQLGGLSLHEADDVRRALGKKKLSVLMTWKDRCRKGFLERGATKEQFEEIWDVIQEFAKYSFNKCVSGDTILLEVEHRTVKELYDSNEDYPLLKSLDDNNELVDNVIKEIRYAGFREVFKLTLNNGSYIKTTDNHKFPTSNGEKMLKDIDIDNDLIKVNCENIVYDRSILSIESAGFEDVYDVEMYDPYHTFTLENGIVTCNSHATAYAQTAYICMWLKVNYPVEYWETALYWAKTDAKDILNYLVEINQSKSISVSSPFINLSEENMVFNTKKETIFWGLSGIKGIGEDTANQMIKERNDNGEYNNLTDFIDRHNYKGSKVKKTAYESLIASGAFDKLYDISENNVSKRLELLNLYRSYKKVKIPKASKNKDIYDINVNENLSKNWWWLLKQKELTGLALIDYEAIAKEEDCYDNFLTLNEASLPQNRGIFKTYGGYVIECKISKSKRGKFARITFENNYKLYKIVIWNEEYEKIKEELEICEKSFIIFSAEIKYESKYTKGNQFTFKKDSFIKILK